MSDGISILIPCYNFDCSKLVNILYQQAVALDIAFEIIVAEDGSTDSKSIDANEASCEKTECYHLIEHVNRGRAAIRNHLAQKSCYNRLLYIDSDMTVVIDNYLVEYLKHEEVVIDGGVCIADSTPMLKSNLRFCYEKAAEQSHNVLQRRQQPYRDFHTANFMIQRNLMLRLPFDERYRQYGYEDVAFGRVLEQHGISILHIDNPALINHFESNEEFLAKTEEGLETLHRFREELYEYSRMLQILRYVPKRPLHYMHRLLSSMERRNLLGNKPRLWVFSLYRMGYYASISTCEN